MSLDQFLFEADRAARQGQFAVAARHYESVLTIAPEHSHAHNFFGQVALQRQALDEAKHHFDRATKGQPAFALAHANLGRVLKQQGFWRDALKALDAAIKIEPNAYAVHFERGEIYEALGEPRNAALSYNQALMTMPDALNRMPEMQQRLQHARDMVMADRRELAAFMLDRVNPIKAGHSARSTRRMDETLAITLGQTRYYPSRPLMFHITRLPSIPFFDREDFDWAPALEAATPLVLAELQTLLNHDASGFEPYVQTGESESPGQFAALDRNLDWGAYFLWKHGKKITAHCERCPNTIAALEQVPQISIRDRAPAVMFSALKPKTHIPPHNGATNARLTCHLPLIIPPGCEFRVGAEVREWKLGELFMFDDTIEHEAINRGEQLRVVLIFDVWHPQLTQLEREIVQATQVAMMDHYGKDAPLGEL